MQGWQLERALLDVEVDLNRKSLEGFTELVFTPDHVASNVLGIHARQLGV